MLSESDDTLDGLWAEWGRRRLATPMDAQVHLALEFIGRLFPLLREYEQSFELFDDACRRGAALWRAQKPDERDDVFPDTAKLVAWPLNELDRRTDALRAALVDLRIFRGDGDHFVQALERALAPPPPIP